VKCLVFKAGFTPHPQKTKLRSLSAESNYGHVGIGLHRQPNDAKDWKTTAGVICVALIDLAPKIHSEGNHPVREKKLSEIELIKNSEEKNKLTKDYHTIISKMAK